MVYIAAAQPLSADWRVSVTVISLAGHKLTHKQFYNSSSELKKQFKRSEIRLKKWSSANPEDHSYPRVCSQKQSNA